MALLTVLLLWRHLIVGFRNQQLVRLMTQVLGSSYSPRQATYDLRRLRRKGLIVRLAGSQRYQLTPFGRRVAVLFTKAHMRVLAPGLALLDPALPDAVADRTHLALAWRRLDRELDAYIVRQLKSAA
jgi:predicted MarR family transcription regulator